MIGLFQVLYGEADGTFRSAETLNGSDGEPLAIPADDEDVIEAICTRPFAVDWDGDGKLDLVVGNFAGTFYWFRGEGKGSFRPKPEEIKVKSGKEPLRLEGHHSDPFAVDWDGDGDLDLLSGSSEGGVQWAENVAGRGKLPELRAFRSLIKPSRSTEDGELVGEEELTGPTTSTRIWVADVNGDGKLDVLVGDCVSLFSPKKGLSAEQFRKKLADWKEQYEKAAEKLSSETLDEAARTKARREYSKLYQKRAEFMEEDETGFVWLYLRK
jgi:hypothetical protein